MTPLLPDVLEGQRRITVDEYHCMIEAGILGEDEHVQLLSGTLVAMTPQGRPHARVVQRLNRLLVRAIGDDLEVLTQLPLTLLDESEPEPDLAVVRAEDAQSAEHHPRTAVLVIEVHREPDPAAAEYRVKTILPSGETLVPAAVPGVRIDVAALFR